MNKSIRTVLILDDDVEVRESFICFFEDHGWRVISASTVEEALELVKHDQPDGAIVDIRLPGRDGTFFIRSTRGIQPKLAFVICTGSPDYQPDSGFFDTQKISSKIFNKPVMDLNALEEELLRLIEQK